MNYKNVNGINVELLFDNLFSWVDKFIPCGKDNAIQGEELKRILSVESLEPYIVLALANGKNICVCDDKYFLAYEPNDFEYCNWEPLIRKRELIEKEKAVENFANWNRFVREYQEERQQCKNNEKDN